ncbi:small acid-soluble spore protein O [Lederbergia lenta]|uniref:Small acid-soluble spore protein O n=1 Tax=Lederbergia lenta TaxID=1467 RepID=A0A2X4YLF6_LEDLE|nr:small acid-soluble spore protein O [Lederbergia lenta]MCM3112534.1 small acid-soluble spore protein O [Lederbergia lenta]MEC2323570.1 small acid-soluble spore protein O [Lederbergia lenta]SQI52585.1 acid-soluble spore protein O [Lederbergia lenta]
MGKKKAKHSLQGMNAAKGQGMGEEFSEEFSNEPLTVTQKLNNKKRKKNQ